MHEFQDPARDQQTEQLTDKWRELDRLNQKVQRALADDRFDVAVEHVEDMENLWHRWDDCAPNDAGHMPLDIIDNTKIGVVETVATKLGIYTLATGSKYVIGQLSALNDKLVRERSR